MHFWENFETRISRPEQLWRAPAWVVLRGERHDHLQASGARSA